MHRIFISVTFFEEHKDEYIERMRAVSAANDWSGWCAFFCRAIHEQAQQNMKIAEEITALYENMKTRLTNILASRQTILILDALFTQPIFKSSRFAPDSGIVSLLCSDTSSNLNNTG